MLERRVVVCARAQGIDGALIREMRVGMKGKRVIACVKGVESKTSTTLWRVVGELRRAGGGEKRVMESRAWIE